MKCNKCEHDFPKESFSFRNLKLNIRHTTCNECKKPYRKKYYKQNRQQAIQTSVETTRNARKRNRQFVWDALKKHSCTDCTENNPIVLDFDHKDGETKFKEVSILVSQGYSIEAIENEIKKCEVRCANCHRIKTSIQFDWYKDVIR